MEEQKNNIREKIKNVAERFKGASMRMSSGFPSLIQRVSDNKKKIVITLVAIVVLIGLGVASFYLIQWWRFKDESPTFSAIRKGELAGTGQIGSKIIMGNLEVTLRNVVESSYRPLELNAQGARITKKYLAAEIMIFNTGYSEKEFLLIGLTDEKGGQYERDKDVEFYVEGIKDFGPAREIYPRTIREGHLVFQAPDEGAKKLQLTIVSETTNKKVVFNIAR